MPRNQTPVSALALISRLSMLLVLGPVLAGDQLSNEDIGAHWLDRHRLCYRLDGVHGPEHWVVDARTGERTPHVPSEPDRLEPRLIERSSDGGNEVHLDFSNRLEIPLRLVWLDGAGQPRPYGVLPPGATRTQHTFSGHAWRMIDPQGVVLAEFVAPRGDAVAIIDAAAVESWQARSAESVRSGSSETATRRSTIFARDHDLFIRDRDGIERALTDDGSIDSSWNARAIHRSPDGTRVLAFRVDAPQRHPIHLLNVAPDDQVEPVLETIDYRKPGDRIPHPHPVGFELESGRRLEVDPELIPNPWSIDQVSWHPDGARVRMLYNQRGHQVLRLVELDFSTGRSRVLIEERASTFIDYAGKLFLHVFADGDRALWMTERSGYNHLEIIDLESGARSPLTEGAWVVRAVDEVDEEAGTVRIRCLGLDPNQDPYHVHHAVIDLQTGTMIRLTDGDGTHHLEFSPDGTWYVDRWSRVDLPPIHELRRARDGALVAVLSRADARALVAGGWAPPERFVAKGRDGRTDIWGIIIRPPGFSADRQYPVIEHIYAGPHGHFVPKDFRVRRRMQDAADLGAVVVQIDGMGTNWRSKAFHDVAWKNLGDSGFPDRIAWMQAAAETRPWMDLDRVGIYGGSAGGQSALRALLAHGDFYDVAVADCGCHDNRMDKIWWNELWMGWPVGPHYAQQSNVTNAHRLQGELMLILGGLDRNVDPASTLQVVDALVKADKDFEFVLLPSAGHGAAESPYGHRRRLDFLKRTLVDTP
ncbi:MAG: prolyl oligopeptidase family serine peptidase [Planctomycetota bacterium]|nr:prolyl oligopeptidase family serine peptidase [Planctomycetota bacterium]